jgi:Fe-S-cluster-containing dehydrogenase component
MACPYSVRYLNEDERVVEKCTLCEQLIAQGELPQCVSQCSGRARFFGDVEQGYASFEGPILPTGERTILSEEANSPTGCVKPYTDSQIYKLPDVGNGPSFAYILRERKWRGGGA